MKFVTALIFALFSISAFATETRCGWIDNPTPANWWLTDAQGEWTLGEQGGYQISDSSWDNLSAAIANDSRAYFEPYNGPAHGRFCGCITGTFSTQHRVVSVVSSKQKPLSACYADPKL